MEPLKNLKYDLNLSDLSAFEPCLDPISTLGANWSGTIIDVLQTPGLSPANAIWMASRVAGDKLCRQLAALLAKEILLSSNNPAPRNLNACQTAKDFADGKASLGQLLQAKLSATGAARHACEPAGIADALWEIVKDNAKSSHVQLFIALIQASKA